MSNVDSISSLSGKVSTGGRVNALKTIQAAIAQVNTASYSPVYSPTYKADRSTASDDSAAPKAGCGLVKAVMDASEGGGGNGLTGQQMTQGLVVLVMVLMPMALALGFRNRARAQNLSGIQRRKFARYNVAKSMKVQIGDQVLDASTDTISLGGISFSSEMKVEKGDKITLKIGEMDQEVQGEIVWCSQQQSYGVKFLEITDALKQQMGMWTAGLNPT